MVRDITGNPTSAIGSVQDTTGRKRALEQLKESEERFRSLTENARVIIGIVQERKFVYVNPFLVQQVGYSEEELLSMDIGQIVHPDFRDMVLERAKKRQLGEPVESHYEFKVITKSGSERWIDYSAARIFYFGKPAIISVALDITEHKQLEEALSKSDQQFRLVTQAARIGGWQWDIDDGIFLDEEARKIFGLTPQAQLTYSGLMQIVHSEDRARVEQVRKSAIEEHRDYEVEYRIIWPDQSIHWIHSRGRAHYDPQGKPLRMYGTFSDITERKKAEQALRESEETFRLLAENANAVIGIIQGKNFVYANPYLEEISGYSRQELLTIDLAKMLHPDFRQVVLERAYKRQMGMEVPSKYQFIMITKSGIPRWMDFCAARIMYRGRPAIVGIALDITEGKNYEQQLVRLKDDLENKNKELEAIIGVVSHDLRSPLVNIKGFANEIKKDTSMIAETLSGEALGETAKNTIQPAITHNIPESISFIETSTESMSRLIESLIQVARVGIAIVKPEKLEITALVSDVIADLEFKIKQKNIQITVDPLPPCTADKTQTIQIFSNIIDNAIKYLEPSRQGRIHISGKSKENTVLYCIKDNGIGIPRDKQEKIFDIFYRFETRLASGEGIGLAMVRRMALRNGGQVCLESEPGKGSTFYVELPA
jgi:PAS domain S-box-containing protein